MFNWKTVEGRGHSDEEREWFRDTAQTVEERFGKMSTIVNIGVFKGCSMHCFRAGAPTAILYGIDVKDYGIIEPDILNARLVKADSTKYHREFVRWIHLLFIDGSHRPEDVLADVEGWGPMVVVGGILAFHDYERTPEEYARRPRSCGSRQLIGVREAVNEWCWRVDVLMSWSEIPAVGSIMAFERVMADE
jgi:hypothetical protein